jgi:hypothetical protein
MHWRGTSFQRNHEAHHVRLKIDRGLANMQTYPQLAFTVGMPNMAPNQLSEVELIEIFGDFQWNQIASALQCEPHELVNEAGLAYFARYVAMMNYAERTLLLRQLECPFSDQLARRQIPARSQRPAKPARRGAPVCRDDGERPGVVR